MIFKTYGSKRHLLYIRYRCRFYCEDLRKPAGTSGQDTRSNQGLQNKQHDRASWYRRLLPRARTFCHEDSYPFWSSAEVIKDACIDTCWLPNIFMGRFVIRIRRILHILVFRVFSQNSCPGVQVGLLLISLDYRMNCTASAVTQQTWYRVCRKNGLTKKKILEVFRINLASYSASYNVLRVKRRVFHSRKKCVRK
jgi:hypothetical protein